MDRVDDRDVQKYYPKLRDFRNAIITRQHAKQKQGKIHDFFKPMPPRASSLQLSHSSDSSGLHIQYTSTDDE